MVFADLSRSLIQTHSGPHRIWEAPLATHNGLDFDPTLSRWGEMVMFVGRDSPSTPAVQEVTTPLTRP